jgi:elongation factor P
VVSVNDLRKGVVFLQDGKTYQVLSFARHKMARAKGVVNVTARDLEFGGVRELTFGNSDKVDDLQLENLTLDFVYVDQRKGKLVFSNPQTKARIELNEDMLEEGAVGYLTSGTQVIALTQTLDDGKLKVYGIDLPKTVELTVRDAPPSDKGDTATGGSKPVTVETGITVNTPFFIKSGDRIRVNTETGEYIERL